MKATPQRLYVALLADLSPGARIAQAIHATATAARLDPDAFATWESGANVTVAVTVGADDLAMLSMEEGAASFREPDRGGEMTGVALYGERVSAGGRRILRRAPLAG